MGKRVLLLLCGLFLILPAQARCQDPQEAKTREYLKKVDAITNRHALTPQELAAKMMVKENKLSPLLRNVSVKCQEVYNELERLTPTDATRSFHNKMLLLYKNESDMYFSLSIREKVEKAMNSEHPLDTLHQLYEEIIKMEAELYDKYKVPLKQ